MSEPHDPTPVPGTPASGEPAPGKKAAPGDTARETTAADTAPQAGGRPMTLAVALFAYTFARLLLVAAVVVIIMVGGRLVDVEVPFLVAAVFGVLIALPLGMVLFKTLRLKVNSEIAALEAGRRSKHDDLQARLRGEK
ncbi:hypothetical protein GTC6_07836 [Gordonia terrae C-6]|uniref:DUF4229 domain-containing protein n=1 Tax=Gordonia terrae C-6 TaxID=1316928 RepID=R7YB63_9ACTN|nr:DUF4229 domain-containing protein [Gordonia terrae]EON33258.1 hypothetical protein GTC6_07836 [Gordonia terrae C-6]